MATWEQGINAGSFMAGIGNNNSNAPQVGAINPTLGLIRENNDLARSGANNPITQGLQGLAGLKSQYDQQQQQRAFEAFNQVHANAWKSGDTSALRDFAVANPAFVAQAQQAMAGLNEQQRADMTNQAAGLRFALAQGPEAYSQYLQKNAGDLTRVGANTDVLAKMGAENPQGAAQLFDTLGLSGQGNKYFDIVDKQQGRTLEQGRLDENARQANMQNDTSRRGQDISASNSAAGREVQLQIHRDNMALSLQALSQKQLNSEKIDPKLVRDLNSDINGYSKNYSAMRGAADNLQALGKRNTPAAQLGMIFNYMKSLDPQSVVREGEQVQVKRTDGIYGTLGNYVSQLSSGKMLNDGQVSDLINTSKLMANTEGEKFNQQMNDYLSSYGDSLPQGLTNQLQSRKAKLYTDVPEAPNNAKGKAISGVNEGATATNPRTGQKLIFRGGQWQPI